MSSPVEAAAKAICRFIDDEKFWEMYKDEAKSALSAALPHLTEGLAEMLDEKLDDFANDRDADGSTFVDYLAAAITEELKRRIEE